MDSARRLVPTAIRRRYAVKFGIALLILGLSVGLIGAGATGAITNQVEDRVQTDHASSAGQEAQSLQMWNEQNEHTIGTIARSDVVASDDPAAIQHRFLDWQEHLDADTFDISYVDLGNETVTASTNQAFRGGSTSEIDNVPDSAYADATANVPWVSDAYLAEGEFGQDTAVITYVQLSAENENRAIVYTADLEAYTNQLQNDDGVTTMVLDGDDEVMLDNTEDFGETHEAFGMAYGGNTSLLDSARTEKATTQQTASSSLAFENDVYGFESDGESEYVTSSARVFGTDWVVVTHEPASQALGFVNTVQNWGWIATILGVLMIGMVGVVLGRNTAVSIDRLTDKASKMEDGDLDVDLETKRIDNIGRLYNGFDSMRVALRDQIEEAEAAREEAERERKRVAEINDHLEETADEYSDVMEAAADGNLTARMDADSENEAMEEIAEEFNQMLEEIEQTVAELNRFATDVATASEQVTASSEEVRSASQQVTESIQEISDGAEQQNQSLQSVNQEMSGLSTTTEEIAASSNEVADIAERTVDTGKDGQKAAQAAITAMDEIETEAGDAVDEIRRLEEEVQQIDELIATISEIARQTNMLALNANIEASRSAGGKDDEGFSVVAKEVKALSEDVAEAADEAEDRLEAIRNRTERSADEVEGTSEQVEDASEQVEEAVQALEAIAELAQETNGGVQEISAATEEQAASTQEVVAMVDDAATISEETTSEAENVAAAAEEQTTALTEVTKSASNLSGQAAQLSEALDRFETDADRSELEMDFEVDDDDDDSSPTPPTFDTAAEPDDAQDQQEQSQGQGITLETDRTDTAPSTTGSEPDGSSEPEAGQPAETFQTESPVTDAESVDEAETEPATDALDADPAGETFEHGSEGSLESEPPVTDAEPAPAPEPDAEPTPAPEPDAEREAPSTDDGTVGKDATELAAEEILGIDDEAETDAAPVADDPKPSDDADDADPLADDAANSVADDADPLADDAAVPLESPDADGDTDQSATPLAEPVDDPVDTDGAADDAEADRGESEAEQNSAEIGQADAENDGDDAEVDESDETEPESDDVFTFGNTDE